MDVQPRRCPIAGDRDEAASDVDRDDFGPTLRGLHRQRTGAATGIEQTQARHVGGQP